MKYGKMTYNQMLSYLKKMGANIKRLTEERERILGEIRELKNRKQILSWDEIASAVAYPKACLDEEKIDSNLDQYTLLHQAERINQIYVSQMENLFAELENIEIQIAKHKYVSRCISQLDQVDKDCIELFIKRDKSLQLGMQIFHVSRSTVYRMQKQAVDNLINIYNKN